MKFRQLIMRDVRDVAVTSHLLPNCIQNELRPENGETLWKLRSPGLTLLTRASLSLGLFMWCSIAEGPTWQSFAINISKKFDGELFLIML